MYNDFSFLFWSILPHLINLNFKMLAWKVGSSSRSVKTKALFLQNTGLVTTATMPVFNKSLDVVSTNVAYSHVQYNAMSIDCFRYVCAHSIIAYYLNVCIGNLLIP